MRWMLIGMPLVLAACQGGPTGSTLQGKAQQTGEPDMTELIDFEVTYYKARKWFMTPFSGAESWSTASEAGLKKLAEFRRENVCFRELSDRVYAALYESNETTDALAREYSKGLDKVEVELKVSPKPQLHPKHPEATASFPYYEGEACGLMATLFVFSQNEPGGSRTPIAMSENTSEGEIQDKLLSSARSATVDRQETLEARRRSRVEKRQKKRAVKEAIESEPFYEPFQKKSSRTSG